MKLVNLSKNVYLPKNGNAVITSIKDGSAVDLLEPDRLAKFRTAITLFPASVKSDADKEQYRDARLKELFCLLGFKADNGSEWTQIFKYPKASPKGYRDSTLIKIKKLYSLPDQTEDWVGKNVRYGIDGDFPKVLVEEVDSD